MKVFAKTNSSKMEWNPAMRMENIYLHQKGGQGIHRRVVFIAFLWRRNEKVKIAGAKIESFDR